tara:strand:- start:99 stop:527 length:429 start_codon:yes stop_codon:yes gene_type:complete
MPICKVCGKKSFWTVDVTTKICKSKNCKKLAKEGASIEIAELKEQKKIEKEKRGKELDNRKLSDKYVVLGNFQLVLWIALAVEIVGGIIVIINTLDVLEQLPGWTLFIYCLVYIFGIFGIYCGIKIIDFLFELDKTKFDKVN